MIIMTEGLRALAGPAMRKALVRFTGSPATGVLTGTVTTAILQSSSATTVATVGLVDRPGDRRMSRARGGNSRGKPR